MRAIYIHCTSAPSLTDKQIIRFNKFLMPEAVCCCLQTCKCVFDIRVVHKVQTPQLVLRLGAPLSNLHTTAGDGTNTD